MGDMHGADPALNPAIVPMADPTCAAARGSQ